MIRIGFVDYYLDEWHANNYPKMIRELSQGGAEVSLAWAEKDAGGGLTGEEWSRKYGVPLAGSLEELIDGSDCLMVLSPDNPERHEELAELPLRSGKRTFIDKTFAPTRAAAERIFAMAARGNTPMYSCSALRFSAEFEGIGRDGIDFIAARGPGDFETYLIHQAEPILALMGTGVRRLLYSGTKATPGLLLEFDDGRRASLSMFGWDCPFGFTVGYGEKTAVINECTRYFENFLLHILSFFKTGQGAVPAEDTVAVMAVLERAKAAAASPGVWVSL